MRLLNLFCPYAQASSSSDDRAVMLIADPKLPKSAQSKSSSRYLSETSQHIFSLDLALINCSSNYFTLWLPFSYSKQYLDKQA